MAEGQDLGQGSSHPKDTNLGQDQDHQDDVRGQERGQSHQDDARDQSHRRHIEGETLSLNVDGPLGSLQASSRSKYFFISNIIQPNQIAILGQ